MDSIKHYLISIFSSALISAIIMRIVGKQGSNSKIIKLVVTVFLSLSIVAPILEIEIEDMTDYIGNIDTDAQKIVSDAQSAALQETVAVIIQRTEAYIEDKATQYGATITATVSISKDDAFIPDAVVINGNISPYGKISLKKIIEDDLGIPEDRQTWN